MIEGKAPITPEVALRLEQAIGRPARFWLALERRYREDVNRLGGEEEDYDEN